MFLDKLFRRPSDEGTSKLAHMGVRKAKDLEGAQVDPGERSFWASMKLTTLFLILFWWIPVLGQMLAGYLGGRRAGDGRLAVFASLLPITVIALLDTVARAGFASSEITFLLSLPLGAVQLLGFMVPMLAPFTEFSLQFVATATAGMSSVGLVAFHGYLVTAVFAYIGGQSVKYPEESAWLPSTSKSGFWDWLFSPITGPEPSPTGWGKSTPAHASHSKKESEEPKEKSVEAKKEEEDDEPAREPESHSKYDKDAIKRRFVERATRQHQ